VPSSIVHSEISVAPCKRLFPPLDQARYDESYGSNGGKTCAQYNTILLSHHRISPKRKPSKAA